MAPLSRLCTPDRPHYALCLGAKPLYRSCPYPHYPAAMTSQLHPLPNPHPIAGCTNRIAVTIYLKREERVLRRFSQPLDLRSRRCIPPWHCLDRHRRDRSPLDSQLQPFYPNLQYRPLRTHYRTTPLSVFHASWAPPSVAGLPASWASTIPIPYVVPCAASHCTLRTSSVAMYPQAPGNPIRIHPYQKNGMRRL